MNQGPCLIFRLVEVHISDLGLGIWHTDSQILSRGSLGGLRGS